MRELGPAQEVVMRVLNTARFDMTAEEISTASLEPSFYGPGANLGEVKAALRRLRIRGLVQRSSSKPHRYWRSKP